MRNMRTRIILAILLCACFAMAQDVRYNYDQQADFSQFKTYKWVDIPSAVELDALTAKQIRDALDRELSKKGFVITESDSADLFVGYQVALDRERQLTAFNTGWGYGPGWRYGGPGMTTATTSTIVVGSLALDVYETPKKQLVWRGIVTKTIDAKAKPEKRLNNLNKAVAKLLKDFPPKKK